MSLAVAMSVFILLPTGWAHSVSLTGVAVTQETERIHLKCAQPVAEQNALINKAAQEEYLVRRVEFVGNEHTRDNVLRRKIMLEEGDVFTREKLIQSLESVGTLKKIIYPVKLSDVEIRLSQSEKIIDMTICFQERRKSPGARRHSGKPAS